MKYLITLYSKQGARGTLVVHVQGSLSRQPSKTMERQSKASMTLLAAKST